MNLSQLVVGIILIGSISCWPEFWLYTKQKRGGAKITQVAGTDFDHNKPTRIIIHGFGSSYLSESQTVIRNAFLDTADYNVIVVDWSDGAAAPNYFNAAPNSKICGTKVGEWLRDNRINKNTLHCIGHSLGAQACGFAGKVYKMARITGLDPAGPGFTNSGDHERLARSDAEFVDVIHCDDTYGIQEPIGLHNDRPAGGRDQPNCCWLWGLWCRRGPTNQRMNNDYMLEGREQTREEYMNTVIYTKMSPDDEPKGEFGCDHGMCPIYFAESVRHKATSNGCNFSKTKCAKYSDYGTSRCPACMGAHCNSMGYNIKHETPTGLDLHIDFYLNVNANEPHCRG